MRLGLIVQAGEDPDAALKKVHDLGLPTAQLGTEDLSDAQFARVTAAIHAPPIAVPCSRSTPASIAAIVFTTPSPRSL